MGYSACKPLSSFLFLPGLLYDDLRFPEKDDPGG